MPYRLPDHSFVRLSGEPIDPNIGSDWLSNLSRYGRAERLSPYAAGREYSVDANDPMVMDNAYPFPGNPYYREDVRTNPLLQKIAAQGRYGDTMLAHITPEEASLLKARGGAGTINPDTGLPEFYDADAGGYADYGGGQAADYGGNYGDGGGYADYGGGQAASAPGSLPGDNPGGYADYGGGQATWGYTADPYSDPGPTTYAGSDSNDWGSRNIGGWVGRQVDKAINNPGATAVNALFSGVPVAGLLNTVSGWMGGPTVGGTLAAGVRGLTGYNGTQTSYSGPAVNSGPSTGLQDSYGGGGTAVNRLLL